MKVLQLKSRAEHISDKNRYVFPKFGFPTIINIQLENWYPPSQCSSMITMFPTKMLKPVCLSLNPLFPLLSKWVASNTHEKIKKR